MRRKFPTFIHQKIRWSALMVLTLMFSTGLMAQRTITGTVTDDASNEVLIGATILIKGTANGTVTDLDGLFSIQANTGDVLQISYTGFSSAEVTVGAENNLSISLTQGVSISEVVVTGYTVDNRRKTSGSVSTVNARDLQVAPSGNVEQQLQGRVAGVTVITNGQPGTTSQVRVRGFGALGGNEPLYVVDGVPVFSVDFLNPDDIETTTVLKDATAASIYGARAAGGVIVYTTKQGKRGAQKMKVTYDGMVGVTTPGSGAPIMSPQDQADWTWAAIRNAAIQNNIEPEYFHDQYGAGTTPVLPDYLLVGGTPNVTGSVDLNAEAANYNIDPEAGAVYQVVKANKSGTDWYDAITRNALINRHNLGFSGGGEKNRFYVGLGMQEQEGIVLHQKFSRYNLRVNTEFDILPMLRVGQNIQATYRATNVILGSDGGSGSSDDENEILAASRMAAIIPVYDEFGGYAGTAAPGFNNPANPVASLDGRKDDKAFQILAFGNVYLEFEPMENLIFRTSFGGRHSSFNQKNYSRRTYENQENNGSFGFSRGTGYNTDWTWTNTARYEKTFGDHKVDLMVGQEALSTGTGRFITSSGINPFSQSPDFVNLTTVSSQVVNEFIGQESRFSSYFGRLNYDWNDKYIISGVVRNDGASRFGPTTRRGTFGAVSLAWRISAESFFTGMDIVDDLKIRGGYGIMGNANNVDPFNQFSLFGTSIGNSSYDISGSNSSATQGFYRTRIGNPLAKWEKAITSNVGIDAILLNGKLDVGIEFWKKETEDLLLQLPVTVMSGNFADAPSVNVGSMENKGIDIQVTNKGKFTGDLSYEFTLTAGFLKNEIIEFAPGIDNIPNFTAEYRGIAPVLNQVGQPISAFFGYEVDHLWANTEEVDQANAAAQAAALAANPNLTPEELSEIVFQPGAAPGRFRFADINGFDDKGELTGAPDGIIDLADRTNLGNPVPDFTGGLTVKLKYKAIELEMYAFTSIGNEIYNVSKVFTDFYPLFPGAAISERVKDSWTFENPNGEIPIFENTSNFSTNTQSNSFYVEDGSYFRMQNVTLGYNIPTSVISSWGLSKFRVFGSVNNLFTITNYSGLDPSVGGAADTNFGIDLGNFPITRSWTFGINLGF